MKPSIKLLIGSIFLMVDMPATVSSQLYLTNSIMEPDWQNLSVPAVFAGKLKTDSIYYFEKKKNNKDSMLMAVLFYNKDGHLARTDEYTLTKRLRKSTVFQWTGGKVSRKITNYESYDSLRQMEAFREEIDYISENGMLTEKTVIYGGNDFADSATTLIQTYLDEQGQELRTTTTLPNGGNYTSKTMHYSNGKLIEEKVFEPNGQWAYSYLYIYPNEFTIRIKLKNSDIDYLYAETVYEKDGRTIKTKKFNTSLPGQRYYNQEVYSYNADGLLTEQIYIDIVDRKHYFRHHYGTDEPL